MRIPGKDGIDGKGTSGLRRSSLGKLGAQDGQADTRRRERGLFWASLMDNGLEMALQKAFYSGTGFAMDIMLSAC